MRRVKGILILGAGMLAGILLGYIVLVSVPNVTNSQRNVPPATGKPVPVFTLNQLTGSQVSLSELKGKPVVINFWATWCPPCREEMPLLNQNATRLQGKVVFIAINDDEDASVVGQYVRQVGLNFPILLDPGGKINGLYFVQSYPNTFFIDSEGILRAEHIGQMDEPTLVRGLEAIDIKP